MKIVFRNIAIAIGKSDIRSVSASEKQLKTFFNTHDRKIWASDIKRCNYISTTKNNVNLSVLFAKKNIEKIGFFVKLNPRNYKYFKSILSSK